MCEKIRRETKYTIVQVNGSGMSNLTKQSNGDHWNETDLVKTIILEGADGTRYTVRPTHHGLSFAKGNITYQKYITLQKRDDRKVFLLFFVSLGIFGLLVLALVTYLSESNIL